MSFLVRNAYVVTMNPKREVFEGGFVAVSDGKIEAVGPAPDAPKKEYAETLDASGMIVIPGLINLHQHPWMNLVKGLADGMVLEPWVFGFVQPCLQHMTLEDLRVSAYLAALEMIRTGATCCLNHSTSFKQDLEFEACIGPMAEVGLRQVFAKLFQCKTPNMPDHPHTAEEAQAFVGGLVDEFHGGNGGLTRIALGVECNAHHTELGKSSDELVRAGHALACERDLRITSHMSGGSLTMDMGFLKYLRLTKRTDVAYLKSLGVLDAHWLLIHGIHFSGTDIADMTEAGCHAVYTPTSESMRGGGVGPWVNLYRAGVNIALGSDGPAVDYSVDMVEQMKACMFIQNVKHLDPTVMSPERVLEMGTVNGARALGMEDEIGSLEPGKAADVAVFDMRGPHLQVMHNPVANFVCCARGADAHTVLINGVPVLREGLFPNFTGVEEVIREATERGRAVAEKAGIAERAKFNWPGRAEGA
ncbi:MAG: amidohydrolase family protein [bacterium]